MNIILRKFLIWTLAIVSVLPASIAFSYGSHVTARASESSELPLPQPQLLTPEAGALINSANIDFSWQGVEAGGIIYTITIDGLVQSDYLTDKLHVAISLSGYPQGSHSWSVSAKRISDAKISTSESRIFFLDTEAPSFQATSMLYEGDCNIPEYPGGELMPVNGQFVIPLDGISSCVYSFNLNARFSETLSEVMNELYLKNLSPTQRAAWVENIAEYDWAPEKKSFYLAALDGAEPFAYLWVNHSSAMIEDAYEYKIRRNQLAFNLPGNIPLGEYFLEGQAGDLAGNEGNFSLSLFFVEHLLNMPMNLKGQPTTDSASLSWDPVAAASSYEVYFKKSVDLSYGVPISVSANSAIVMNLETDTKYDFMVCAISNNGKRGESSFITLKTAALAVTNNENASIPSVQQTQSKSQPRQQKIKFKSIIDSASAASNEDRVEIPKVQAMAPSDDAGEATDTEESMNYTPWLVLFILILLAGAATGAYFYWFSDNEDGSIPTDDKIKPIEIDKTIENNKGPISSPPKPKGESPTQKRW